MLSDQMLKKNGFSSYFQSCFFCLFFETKITHTLFNNASFNITKAYENYPSIFSSPET